MLHMVLTQGLLVCVLCLQVMMRCAAAEYGPLGLRVNCINPGAVGEHMTQEPRLGLKMQQDEQRCTIALLVGYNIDVM